MRYAVLFGLAIASRLIMLLFVQPSMGGDASWYLHAAEVIRSGHVPDLFRPPLYPAFLAALPDWRAAYMVQPLMTIGISCLCLRLTGSFTAALLIAICPFLIIYEYGILAEILLVTLLVSAWLLLDHGRAVAAGILLGLCILTRDTMLLLPLSAIPVGYLLGKGRPFLIAAAAAYLTISPWVLTQGSLSSGRAGYALWIGTWERNGDWQLPGLDRAAYPPQAFTDVGQERELRDAYKRGDDQAFKSAALDRMRSDPLGVVTAWAVRYPQLWIGTRTEQATVRLERGSAAWTVFKASMWGLNLIMLFAGLAGLIMSKRRILAIPILYIALIYIPFHNTEPRYSLPAIPFLLIYAADLRLRERWRIASWRSARASAGATAGH